MEYKLTRRRGQKNIRMHFNDRGELLVSCPYLVSRKQIEEFIESKKDWISEHKKEFVSHTYQDGDNLPYFGKILNLRVLKGQKTSISVSESEIIIISKNTDSEHIKKNLKKYYTRKLSEFCFERILFWSEKTLVRTPNLQIDNSKSRWGVCFPKKELIKISLMSAALEPDLLDTIVLHEVCHLSFCNHQKEFYNLMERCMPDYRQKNTRFKQFVKTGVTRNLF